MPQTHLPYRNYCEKIELSRSCYCDAAFDHELPLLVNAGVFCNAEQ